MRGRWLILAGAALALHSTAQAGDGFKEICIREGVDDGAVNDIAIAPPPADHPEPDANYEGLQQLEVHGFPEQRIALLRWDLSNLKLSTPPQAVKLRLNFTKMTSASVYGVHALLRPWTSSEATWLRPNSAEAWSYPGAEPGTDFDPADLAAFVPDHSPMDIYLDGGVELVEQWASDGGENFGILIRNAVALDDAKFWSAEGEVLSRPALVLSFADGELIVRDVPGVYSGEVDTNIVSGVAPTERGQVLVVKGATLGSNSALADPAVSLLRFDVSRLPPLARVVGATLELWQPAERSGRVVVDGMARAWSDQEATWNHAANATAWTTPGALAVGADGGDRLGWVAADFQPSDSSTTVVELTDAGIALVQGWVSGEIPNHGFFMGASSPETVAMFVNSEARDDSQRPMLCVRYVDRSLALQIPCGCSAGGGLTVTALAFSLLLRGLRRRRV